MARSLGTLTVDLIADLGGWSDGMSKAERDAEKTSKGIAASFSKVGGALAAIGAVLSVDAFAGWINGAIEFADASQDAAAAAGVATNEWLKLSGAASIMAGESANMQKALVGLNEKIVENDESLKGLGIATRDAQGNLRSAYDVFLDVSDSFAQMDDGAAKTAKAVELFGAKVGPELIPMLNAGSASIKDIGDSVATLSDGLANAQGEWEENTFRLKGVFDTVRNTIAENLLPVVNDLLEWAIKFAPALKPVGEVLGVVANIVGGVAVFAFKSFATTASIVIGIVEALGKALATIAATLVKVFEGDFAGAWEVLKAGGNDMLSTAKSTADQLISLWGDETDAANQRKAMLESALDVEIPTPTVAPTGTGAPGATSTPAADDPLASGAIVIQDYQAVLDEQARASEEFRAMQKAADDFANQQRLESLYLTADEILGIESETNEILARQKEENNARMYQGAKGFLGNLSTLMNGESKKAFEIGKKASIAQALIATYESATQAYKSLAGIPIVGPALGVAAAAAAVAAGMVNVNSIRSQQFGGGGGRPAVPATVAASAAGTPYSPEGLGGIGGRNVYVSGIDPNSIFSGQQLLDLINDATRNGGVLRVANV